MSQLGPETRQQHFEYPTYYIEQPLSYHSYPILFPSSPPCRSLTSQKSSAQLMESHKPVSPARSGRLALRRVGIAAAVIGLVLNSVTIAQTAILGWRSQIFVSAWAFPAVRLSSSLTLLSALVSSFDPLITATCHRALQTALTS